MTLGIPSARGARRLDVGWELARAAPDAGADPDAVAALEWRAARVPGTVAASLDHDPRMPGCYDRDDWWYRLRFEARDRKRGARYRLRFAGLATLAEAWLNGTPIASSRNAYVASAPDVTALLKDQNEILIRFASLDAALAGKRPRGRWKSALVARQDLRWFRTPLLGRMPGWTPAIDTVGPWRPVTLEWEERVALEDLRLQADALDGVARLRLTARASALGSASIEAARIRLDDRTYDAGLAPGAATLIDAELSLPESPLWWPHTHGAPRLVACAIELRVAGEWLRIDCGRIGFRAIELDANEDAVRFVVNGDPVFCRGVCWTPLDLVTLRGDRAELRAALVQLRDAGANMVRVGGTMVYETDPFYELCDELGILVWQDFMFANLDYPAHDAQFLAEVEAEARSQLARLQLHPCVAAYCGGSEVAQQAAMLGLPASFWSNAIFTERLPALCAERHPGIPYFPSTPWGGALPFHPGSGLAHYYGVGAYRRPLNDARLSRVKFATECLAFSNVPDEVTLAALPGGPTPAPHHPDWKARQPRDNGAGWDFEDVRDHYLTELFGADAVSLRSRDLARYFALSRVVPGELMRRVFAEWRSSASDCGGALVWLHRDFVAGAGWGIVDAGGRPKAPYWYLKRAWAPRSIHLTDEGLNGLAMHVVNEAAEPLAATVALDMLRADGTAVDRAQHGMLVPARGTLTLNAEAMLGYFSDSTAAYRFGPPRHEAIVARLLDVDGSVLSEDFHFPEGMKLAAAHAAQVRTAARWTESGEVLLDIVSDAFLQAVSLACEGFVPDDNYFHLAPGREKRIVLRPIGNGGGSFAAHLEALNLTAPIALRASRAAGDRAA